MCAPRPIGVSLEKVIAFLEGGGGGLFLKGKGHVFFPLLALCAPYGAWAGNIFLYACFNSALREKALECLH
jgi:hypothetical protein